MVKESLAEKRSQRETINSSQRIRSLMDRYQSATSKLVTAYSDEDGERSKEIQAIGGPNEFAEFYSRLKTLKDVHRKNPNESARPLTLEFQEMIEFIQDPNRIEKEIVRFTDEEGYGKYLDMHLLFEKYINLKGVTRIDYITYLTKFDHLYEISKEVTKKTGAYKEYLTALSDYLEDFTRRAKPLLDLEREMTNCEREFEPKWRTGKIPGWGTEKAAGALSKPSTGTAAPLDLSSYHTVESLEALGADRLKSALLALDMKCGGTLRERADRLFNTKDNNVQEMQNGNNLNANNIKKIKEEIRQFNLAKVEYRIYKLSEFVSAERAATRENIERKQARTAGEEEEEEEVEEFYDIDERDDGVPYNPKNLPLGWDGKPIPYWLYKLHGLNIGYSCEICGNQVYKGPKAFQRHFTEWRHSHGMRCLGIPNTAHFANVTKINEAIELWKKICEDKNKVKWSAETDEEYEDSLGNVVNRRTFEDLKRQGLL